MEALQAAAVESAKALVWVIEECPATAVATFLAVAVVAWITCQPPLEQRTTLVGGQGDESDVNVTPMSSAGRAPLGAIRARRRPRSEYPPPYPNGWYQLCFSHELKRGETKHVEACGLHLALWRSDVDGTPVAVDAFCPHLGANLGVGGEVVTGTSSIRCPFHSWEFDGKTGRCTNIPYSAACQAASGKAEDAKRSGSNGVKLQYEARGGKRAGGGGGGGKSGGAAEAKGDDSSGGRKVPGIPSGAHTTAFTVMERNSMILVWYDAEGREPTWELRPVPEIDGGAYRFDGMCDHRVTAHIQELPENGADVNHLPALHEPFIVRWLQPLLKHDWSMAWEASKDVKHVAIGKLDQRVTATLPRWLGGASFTVPFTKIKVVIEQEGPGIVTLSFNTPFGRAIIIETVTPVAPLLQRTTHIVFGQPIMPRAFAKQVLRGLIVQCESCRSAAPRSALTPRWIPQTSEIYSSSTPKSSARRRRWCERILPSPSSGGGSSSSTRSTRRSSTRLGQWIGDPNAMNNFAFHAAAASLLETAVNAMRSSASNSRSSPVCDSSSASRARTAAPRPSTSTSGSVTLPDTR